jgi:hypothetical protein
MSVAGVVARAMAAGLGIDEASRRMGRLAALNGQPAWDCPEECERLSYFLGHAAGVSERRFSAGDCCSGERADPERTQ